MELYNAASWLIDRQLDAGRGAKEAIICGPQTLSYAELQDEVHAAANGLRALGIHPEERVVLLVNDEPAFLAWFLGAMRIGAVPVPVSTMLTEKEIGFIVDDARAPLIVASGQYANGLPVVADVAPDLGGAVLVSTTEDEIPDGHRLPVHLADRFDDRSEVAPFRTRADSPAFWLYTSGTTGSPKGAMHRHIDLQATADTYGRTVLQIKEWDRCYSVAKLFFAYGLGNSMTFPFSVGATAVLDPGRPTPAGVANILASARPTLFFSSPGFCAAMVDSGVDRDVMASVRYTMTAGEALPAEVYRRFHDRFGVEVLDGIGSTEALHIFISNKPGQVRPGTSGTPVEGYQIRLLDESDQEISQPDTPGYLDVKGESVATGYWCRTETTRATFRGEWLRTGDVYSRSSDGYYTFLGRNNDMIKAGGMWVSPAEVENVILQAADVLECAVVGSRNPDGLETVVAFVVPKAGRTIDPAVLEEHCRSQMAAFKRPRRTIVVDALPKTATGKIRRFALRDQLKAGTA
jgi:benzoate-CoA ligase family protein